MTGEFGQVLTNANERSSSNQERIVAHAGSVNSRKQGSNVSMERQKIFREDLKKQSFEVVQSSAHDTENQNSMNRADSLANQELKNTVKYLRQQLKTYKDEIKQFKHDVASKNLIIENQEKILDKMRLQHQAVQSVAEVSSELKKCESKLKKMRERRDALKEARDSLQQANHELKITNGQLAEQVAQMQESSHKTRSDCTKLKQKLTHADNEVIRLNLACNESQNELQAIKEEKRRTESDIVAQIK